jgi:hypothetical protein
MSLLQLARLYVSIRQQTSAYTRYTSFPLMSLLQLARLLLPQHTSAYVSIRQHTQAYVSIRQHTLGSGTRARLLLLQLARLLLPLPKRWLKAACTSMQDLG